MAKRTSIAVTREQTWALTAASVILFLLLCWLFADGVLAPPLWLADDWVSSPLITYILIVAILLAGWSQAQALPAAALTIRLEQNGTPPGQVRDPLIWQLLLGNIYFSLLWLPVRFFVGRDWLSAGLHKVGDPAWTDSGEALQGFWQRAVTIPEQGRPAITYDWFRQLLQYMLDSGWYTWFAKLVAWGEVLIGLGLILGGLVGIAAFFGTVLNFSFMLAGTASSNPVLFGLAIFLVLAWKVAGYWGLDRWLLPRLGTPWHRAATNTNGTNGH